MWISLHGHLVRINIGQLYSVLLLASNDLYSFCGLVYRAANYWDILIYALKKATLWNTDASNHSMHTINNYAADMYKI